MFVPKAIGAWAEKALPPSVTRLLHAGYDPFYLWNVIRLNRRIGRQLFPDGNLFIAGGPFQGMRFLTANTGSALLPKLLGAYEAELHGSLKAAIQRRYPAVVDIGCAEGYYLVGLALALPAATVHGFDLDPVALNNCLELARLNHVEDRVRLHGICTPETLSPLVAPGTFIVCDCEGAERELLDPARVPGLADTDILVELHEPAVPGITAMIRQRFSLTHEITTMTSAPRDAREYPLASRLSPRDQRLALDEHRKPGLWAFLQTRRRPESIPAGPPAIP